MRAIRTRVIELTESALGRSVTITDEVVIETTNPTEHKIAQCELSPLSATPRLRR